MLLLATSIIITTFTLAKARNRKEVFAFYLTILGLTFIAETILFNFLKAYQYMPMVIEASPFDDGLLGNIISQTSLTAIAVLICVLDLSFSWFIIFTSIYCFIEISFLKLGIYKQFWYRTWISFIFLIILFWSAKKIYAKLKGSHGRFFMYGLVYFGLFAIYICAINWPFKLAGYVTFNETLLRDPIRSYTLVAVSKSLFEGTILMFVYFTMQKWTNKLITIAFLYLGNFALTKLNLMIVNSGLFWFYATVSIFGMYFIILFLDRLYGITKPTHT